MAGHSKWANLGHRKERIAAKRGKVFLRLIEEITDTAALMDIAAENNAVDFIEEADGVEITCAPVRAAAYCPAPAEPEQNLRLSL